MNSYDVFKQKQQEDYDKNSPAGYAFGQDQFNKMMEAWDLDPVNDCDKIVRVFSGVYLRKEDRDQFHALMQRLHDEMEEKIAADQTGDGFVYEMFYSELNNHEYSYTGDVTDALEELGYTVDQINEDPVLRHGLNKAIDQIKKDVENGDIW